MTAKKEDDMTTLFDQSDRAFERLYMRSSHTFGHLAAASAPSKEDSAPQAPRQKSKKPKEHIDIERLNKLTRSLHKTRGSPSSFVDYYQFAEQNFDPHGVFTKPTKNGKGPSDRAKELYNEVQRSSLNFGVTSEEMKSYHKRRVSALSDYSVQQSPQSPKPVAQLPSPPSSGTQAKKQQTEDPTNKEKNDLSTDTPVTSKAKPLMAPLIPRKAKSHKQPRLQVSAISSPNTPGPVPVKRSGTSITVTPRRHMDKLPLDEATDVTKRQGVLLEPFESSHSQSKSNLLTPPSDFIDTTVFDKKLIESESDSATEGSPLLAEQELSPFEDDPFTDKGMLTKKESTKSRNSRLSSTDGTPSPSSHSRLMSHRSGSQSSLGRSTFGSLFRKKSHSSITPSRKECHRVEDTLQADKEFNDFSIAKRRSGSYYQKSLEFSFEKPNSRSASSRSSIVSQSPRPSPSEQMPTPLSRPHSITTFSTPQASPRLQRHSMGESLSSAESSPVTPTRRVIRGHPRGSNSMYSPYRAKSASLIFDPIVEHEPVEHYDKALT